MEKNATYSLWNDKNRFFIPSGECRKLKKGDFYLSGAIPEVYEYPGTMSFQHYNICVEILK